MEHSQGKRVLDVLAVLCFVWVGNRDTHQGSYGTADLQEMRLCYVSHFFALLWPNTGHKGRC